jgi:hypothetical protein
MQTEIKDNKLIITIDLLKPSSSKSGKTLIVASTNGPFVTDCKVAGKVVTININAYIAK